MSRTPKQRLTLTPLEDRSTPAAGLYAVGVAAGQTGDAVVYDSAGTEQYRVSTPYGSDFTGGVRTALADVNGDGTPDLITAPGAGTAATVNVYDGANSHALLGSFNAFEASFTGGAYVAAADLTHDGMAEVVVGADQGGGPRVRVFDGSTVVGSTADGTTAPTTLADFLAIDDAHFRGGVRLALGDVDGDGTADLVVSAGFGGGPRVAAFDGASLARGSAVRLFPDFFAFEQSLRNGAFVSVGDVNGDGRGDLIFGAGPGGGPRVLELDGGEALRGRHTELGSFFAGDPGSRQGVQPGVVTNADGSVSVTGTDVQTGSVGLFDPHGHEHGRFGGPGGPFGGVGAPPFVGAGGLTQADAAAVTTALEGAYAGTGSGTLSTITGGTTAPATSDASVSASVDITSATAVLPPSSITDTSSAPLRAMTVTGTVTLTVGSADPVTLPFTGTLQLMGGTADAPRGALYLTTDLSGSSGAAATGFTLSGVLHDGTVSADWLVETDHPAGGTGTVFQARAGRGVAPISLTRT